MAVPTHTFSRSGTPRVGSRYLVFATYLVFISLFAARLVQREKVNGFPSWKPGFLDIHHLRLGPDQCTYIVFPDGTQVVVDLGELDVRRRNAKKPPSLHSVPQYPDNNTRAAERALHAITLVALNGVPSIDYAVVSHYHTDHVGNPRFEVEPQRGQEQVEDYDYMGIMIRRNIPFRPVGIIDLIDKLNIKSVFDRGTFFPPSLLSADGKSPRSGAAQNYLAFRKWSHDNGERDVHTLTPCADNEIVPSHNDTALPGQQFRIVALKTANLVCMHGRPEEFPDVEKADENQMSLGFELSYGDFRYVETGDNEGPSLDAMIAGMGESEHGEHPVDIVTPGHHAHGMPEQLVTKLQPTVFVQQSWCADHMPEEQVRRMLQAGHVYATGLHPTALRILNGYNGLRRPYSATEGQVSVRVYPKTKRWEKHKEDTSQKYEVFVINGRRVSKRDMYSVTAKPS